MGTTPKGRGGIRVRVRARVRPLLGGTRGVIRVCAVSPMAVLDGVVPAALLHQLGIERLVALPATAIDFDSIKIKGVEVLNR